MFAVLFYKGKDKKYVLARFRYNYTIKAGGLWHCAPLCHVVDPSCIAMLLQWKILSYNVIVQSFSPTRTLVLQKTCSTVGRNHFLGACTYRSN